MPLTDVLADEVCDQLGLPARPAADHHGLTALYAAWCRRVPFDNIRKRIHLDAGDSAVLPGTDPEDFFRNWIAHRTGGTCFPTSGALAALLEACGFHLDRVAAAMLNRATDTVEREDHGTVIVQIDGGHYFVDSSILHSRPLLLSKTRSVAVDDPLHPLTATPEGDLWRIDWELPHDGRSMVCRLLRAPVTTDDAAALYEATRTDSGFNPMLYAYLRVGDGASVLIGSNEYHVDSRGRRTKVRLEDRRARLVELGYSPEIAEALPADVPREG